MSKSLSHGCQTLAVMLMRSDRNSWNSLDCQLKKLDRDDATITNANGQHLRNRGTMKVDLGTKAGHSCRTTIHFYEGTSTQLLSQSTLKALGFLSQQWPRQYAALQSTPRRTIKLRRIKKTRSTKICRRHFSSRRNGGKGRTTSWPTPCPGCQWIGQEGETSGVRWIKKASTMMSFVKI